MSYSDTDDASTKDVLPPHTPPPHPPALEPYMAFTTIPRAAPGTTCCSISTFLHNNHTTLLVTSATKVADGLTATAFVAYTIKVGVCFRLVFLFIVRLVAAVDKGQVPHASAVEQEEKKGRRI